MGRMLKYAGGYRNEFVIVFALSFVGKVFPRQTMKSERTKKKSSEKKITEKRYVFQIGPGCCCTATFLFSHIFFLSRAATGKH